MNSTSLALANVTPQLDKNVTPQAAWKLSDRWAWAYGLPVSAIARAVAGCIAYHANDKTGLSWPGMALIVTETGFCRNAVIAAIKVLERGGHVTVRRFKVGKKNAVNRYQLPPMGNVSASHPSAPDALGGSASDAPEQVHTELVRTHRARERLTCDTHGRSWPASWGSDCYECAQARTKRPERPKMTRLASDSRSAQINSERLSRIRAERGSNDHANGGMTTQQTADAGELAIENGWEKVAGSWQKRR